MEDWNNTSENENVSGTDITTSGKRNYEKYLEGDIWSPEQNAQGGNAQADADAPYFTPYEGYERDRQQAGQMPLPNQVVDYHGLEEPVSVGEWIVSMLLMLVPCLNIIMMFVWAFGKSEKKSKSNFFKASLIYTGVILALYLIMIIFVVIGAVSFSSFG